MGAAEKCSAVGVRDDGVRVVIDDGIEPYRAHFVKLMMIVANAYPDVIVESDWPKERRLQEVSATNELQLSADQVYHRVIGIRQDGMRLVLCENLSLPRAESIRADLYGITAFRELLIEVDTGA